jgi:hypothetical protein
MRKQKPTKSYIVTKQFDAPYVVGTGMAHRPTKVNKRTFRKGQVITKGVMQYANGQPAFLLVSGVMPIPLECIKEVVAKDVVSSFDGGKTSEPKKKPPTKIKSPLPPSSNPKVKYIDALLIGGLAGLVAVHFAQKKGYITNPDNKIKLYGALGGGLLAWYVVYRQNTNAPAKVIEKNSSDKKTENESNK